MKKLETYLYDKLKGEDDTEEINLLNRFFHAGESSPNNRRGAIYSYHSFVNVVKRISDESSQKICHTKILDKVVDSVKAALEYTDNKLVFLAAQCSFFVMQNFETYTLLNFEKFFEQLLRLVDINDSEIKELTNSFDNGLKTKINSAFQGNLPEEFNVSKFFLSIIDKLKMIQPKIKTTVVSWITCINRIPGIKLINIIYLFLGSLFDMLEDKEDKREEMPDITKVNECLNDFYDEFSEDFDDISSEIKNKIFEIVIESCKKNQQKEKNVKVAAFNWACLIIKKYKLHFILISKDRKNIQSKKSNNLIGNKEENEKDEKEDDKSKLSFDLYAKYIEIIFESFKTINILKEVKLNITKEEEESNKKLLDYINTSNSYLLEIMEKYDMTRENILVIENIFIESLSENSKSKDVLLNVINWIDKFFNKLKEDAFKNDFEKFIKKFTSAVICEDNDIFDKGISTLCNIEKCRKKSIDVIIKNILNNFKEQSQTFFKERLKKIVQALSKELNVRNVYKTFSEVLKDILKDMQNKDKEKDFVCKIINILNMLLLTASETESLRNGLKNIQNTTNEEDKKFFEKLFEIWCINPISCLILCLIVEDFELSHQLMLKFGDLKLKLIKSNYLEYAQLLQILESNAFLSKFFLFIIIF